MNITFQWRSSHYGNDKITAKEEKSSILMMSIHIKRNLPIEA